MENMSRVRKERGACRVEWSKEGKETLRTGVEQGMKRRHGYQGGVIKEKIHTWRAGVE